MNEWVGEGGGERGGRGRGRREKVLAPPPPTPTPSPSPCVKLTTRAVSARVFAHRGGRRGTKGREKEGRGREKSPNDDDKGRGGRRGKKGRNSE